MTVDFEELYERQFDFVWRTTRGLGIQPPATDDVVQDVFTVVHRRLADFRPGTSEKAWLFRITRNVVSDYRRSARRRGLHVELDEASCPPSTGCSPFDAAARREARNVLQRFLSTLDEAKRSAFVLSELEQMTVPEIAVAVDANINTVYSRVRAARKAFLEAVHREREGDPGGVP